MVAAQLPSSIEALEAKRAGRVQSKVMEVDGAMLAVNNSIGYYSPGVPGFQFRWYLHPLLDTKARGFLPVHALSADFTL